MSDVWIVCTVVALCPQSAAIESCLFLGVFFNSIL